ncbi:MAG TPA: heparinase II/III family protein, partial [Rectinemataceae bacterium]|nr:heparinase II/III family protein [Rectinemataceae bacterium]
SLYRTFDETGDRAAFEAPYFERRRRLVATGLAAWLWKKPEDIACLEDTIWAICNEYTWALPAHLEGGSLDPLALQRAGKKTGGGALWPHREYLDLFACETGFALAEITTILEGSLAPIVTERARLELGKRVLKPFLARKEPWRWELMRNNWCAVCAGSIGAAALYIERDERTLSAIIDRVLPTMERFISSFADDGACLEGSGYWTYGVGFFLSFADMLEKSSGGLIDLAATDKFRRIAAFMSRCYLNDSMAISFADGSSGERYRIGIAHFLARRFPGLPLPYPSLAADFTHDHYGRWCLAFRDLLWARGAVAPVIKPASSEPVWLPDAQWLICPARAQDSLAFAAKGGHNDEPHNHNDVGSFELISGKSEFLADLGCGSYTRDYFGAGRYSILCNSSLGHSLPIIDGRGQESGAARRAKILEFRRAESHAILRMDIAAAYNCPELLSLERSFDFDGGRRLVLCDKFIFSRPGIAVIERFMTRAECGLRLIHDSAEEDSEKKTLCGIYWDASSPTLSISCSVNDAAPETIRHKNVEHDGEENRITSLDYTFATETTSFVVVFEFNLESAHTVTD